MMDFEIKAKHFRTFLKFLVFAGILFPGVNGVEQGSGNDGQNGGFLSSTESVIMSVALLCTVVLVTVGCTFAWWRRVLCFWKKTGTHEAPPDWFIPGYADNTATSTVRQPQSFSSLDASNLQRDHPGREGRSSISIEPLPSLGSLGLDVRDSFELRTFRTPGIVPTRTSSVQGSVEDWLQEPETGFPRQNLEYQKIVGKGWFGKVLEAEATNIKKYMTKSNVIVRELRANATDEEQKQFLDEARMFRHAYQQHEQGSGSENVLKLLGFCIEQMPYILIFEYFPLGDLKTYLKQRSKQAPAALKPGDDGILSRIIIDIIRGVKWMIQSGFVHGDLAARNCLVATAAGKVVIGDYGYSTQKHRADYFWTSNRAIPVRWAAPETLSFSEEASPSLGVECFEITHEANIWSLGVVIWEVFQLGKLPYDHLMDEEVIRKVIRQGDFILEPPQLPFINGNTRERIYQLLVSCWNSIPNHRPSIETIEEVFTTPS